MKEKQNFGCISVPENNGKQNPGESLTSKFQKHVACSISLTWVKMLFIILLILRLKKVITLLISWKNNLTKILWWQK